MIAELPGGREIKFPDSMDDAAIEQIVQALLGAEQRAQDAIAECKALRDRLDAQVAAPAEKYDDAEIVAAVNSLRAVMEQGFAKMVAAQRADRKLMFDETGEPTHSRIA
jgi:hypothetical protein